MSKTKPAGQAEGGETAAQTEAPAPAPASAAAMNIVTAPHGAIRRNVPAAEANKLIAEGKARAATARDLAIGG